MRVHRTATAGCALLFALVTAGCAGQDDGTADAAPASPSAPSEPTTAYAPYVSATTASATDTAGSPTTYNLAFAISSGDDCVPRWNGVQDIDDASVASRVEKLRESGATVRVSFGGASGSELGTTCTSADALAAAYGKVVDAYKLTKVDFDVEGGALPDTAANTRRAQAIAALQKQHPGLDVSFTLPVMPEGLTQAGVDLLADAKENGVGIDAVNIMAMDYGPAYSGDMGTYAEQAATATQAQIKGEIGRAHV